MDEYINMSNNSRIAKNSVIMYIRTAITMLVGLYTSRVVLQALGVEDYGLYNVIGGIITFFGVLNYALINTTSRFITISTAQNNKQQARSTFNTALIVHFLVGIIVVSLGETVGLWYLHNKLIIPEGREIAAEWLYQFTIISTFIHIVNVPFNAIIVAYEKINMYAIIQIIDAFLKLAIAIAIQFVTLDKLIFFAFLIMLISVFNLITNHIYCRLKFHETKFKLSWDWIIYKDIMHFAGWALIGNFIFFFYTQGINLLLNAFCGPAVNAARGIAVQVQGVISNLSNNVQTAINPQITKSYAIKDLDRMYALIFASSKFCFYLLLLISLPILIETKFVLTLWLGTIPDYTVNFLRIILLCVLLNALINPMFTAHLASGRMAIYYIPHSILMYSFMIITIYYIKKTRIPESVFVCYLCMNLIGYVMKIFILHIQIGLKPTTYVNRVLIPVIFVFCTSLIVPFTVHQCLEEGWIAFFSTSFAAILSVLLSVFLLGITTNERQLATTFIRNRIYNIKKMQ